MSDGILGLGSDGSVDLNSELIAKLKTADTTAILDPITEDIEDTNEEIEALDTVQTAVTELLDLVADFDLYTTGTNIFDEISATTTGSSATYDAADTASLEPGTISVSVEQLAQKDVYQSSKISDTTAEMDSGTITIAIGEDSYDFSTSGKTYDDLVDEMNNYSKLDVALEQVSEDSYRMVIKSANSGESNALTITQIDIDLGLEDSDNHVLTAQNMKASIDGIDYELATNKVTMDSGLIITAVEEGDSSISMERDDTAISDAFENIVNKYNEIVDLITAYTIGDEDTTSVMSDTSTLRTMMTNIKEILFDSYGLDDEESVFMYGVSFDSDGYMQLDSDELSEAITDNYDDLKELFVGYAEKEGIGTRLKTYLDSLDGLDGLLTTYGDNLDDRVDTLEDNYDTQSDKLDEKYEAMANQFAEYTVIITEMENSFASLKLLIDGDD